MMQEWQNALFISDFDPTKAVILDRGWLQQQADRLGLLMTRITPPTVRGFQWTIYFQKRAARRQAAQFSEDRAPRGVVRAYAGGAPLDNA